jgi:DNA/RNA endonuclease YhcR with UshA esterase domain
MKENIIRNVSIVCSIVGLAVLFFLSKAIQLNQTDINKISYEDVGKNVRICGELASKYSTKAGHQFLKIKDSTGSITAVIFNTTAKKFDLNSIDKKICVTGNVDEYENRLEIIAKNIQVV